MPMHKGLLPREGFRLDAVVSIIRATVLNPALLLPLTLLARLTRPGQDLGLLHPRAYACLHALLGLGAAGWVSGLLSRAALNNWVLRDRYNWAQEIVLVTGGAGGIGGHIVQLLAERGVTVVVLDIQPLSYPAPSTVHYFECDITSPGALARVADEIRAKVGDPTVIINNAGVVTGKTILGATEDEIRFTFDVNTLAHFWVLRAFLPPLVRANHGTVVTVSSTTAWSPLPRTADYAASKAAAQAVHEALVAELASRRHYAAPRVRTILVVPGFTRTSLFAGFRGSDDMPFSLPALAPETVAEAVVRQVLRGESARLFLPAFAGVLPALRAAPYWLQAAITARTRDYMGGFRGRQVVDDLGKWYAEREERETER